MSLFVLFTGSRLAVSALIDVNGYHIPSVDIWTCTEDHNMDSTHFLMWLDSTCATLREEIGKLTHFELCFSLMISDAFFVGEKKRIAICLDTQLGTQITEESVIPKRVHQKAEIQQWLKDRKLIFRKIY
jgi:hypothetical protein